MENIINFLLDNYIWVMIVGLIIIVILIGVIVDTKKKQKRLESISKEDNNEKMANTSEDVKTVSNATTNLESTVLDSSLQQSNINNSDKQDSLINTTNNIVLDNNLTQTNIEQNNNQELVQQPQVNESISNIEIPVSNEVNKNIVDQANVNNIPNTERETIDINNINEINPNMNLINNDVQQPIIEQINSSDIKIEPEIQNISIPEIDITQQPVTNNELPKVNEIQIQPDEITQNVNNIENKVIVEQIPNEVVSNQQAEEIIVEEINPNNSIDSWEPQLDNNNNTNL